MPIDKSKRKRENQKTENSFSIEESSRMKDTKEYNARETWCCNNREQQTTNYKLIQVTKILIR